MFLLLKDKPLLHFDLDECIVDVIERDLLPFSLRSNIVSYSDMKSRMYNVRILEGWLSSRMLASDRDNFKQLCSVFQIPQRFDLRARVSICLKCNGLSVTDYYWVKEDTDTREYRSVDLRYNHFSDIVTVALRGDYPSFTTSLNNPELTTKGLFRKAWVRHARNGKLCLLKSDKTPNYVNTKMEVLSSKVLDCFTEVSHVKYEQFLPMHDDYVSICENFTYGDYSFVEAYEVMEYCKGVNIDYKSWCLSKFGSDFANIPVIDFILMNTDRHDANYGFLMSNCTGELCAVAPLFDHNLALVADVFYKDVGDTMSQMFNSKDSIESLAKEFFWKAKLSIDYRKFFALENEFVEFPHVYERLKYRITNLWSLLGGV